MNTAEFRKHAHELVDWMADYFDQVEKLPVLPPVNPGQIKAQLPLAPPDQPEGFDQIFDDFKNIILPGMTHWQHPGFFAYFNANNSKPSVLAEMLTATLGSQCMIWLTSPAATELEDRMMEWLGQMLGLPNTFTGVIQDTASTATLCAILTAREKKTGFKINQEGFNAPEKLMVYCSEQAHSSIEKAVKIAGLGQKNLRKVPVDQDFALITARLEQMISEDTDQGYIPLCVISAIGTTGSTAIDPVRQISQVCQKYDIWHHVDAALAGTALLVPEMRWMADGVEMADSFVFNPHKWMFVNFDCSAYFVKDPQALINTFSITPEYLKTYQDDQVNNYRDWGIQLGRRFRALKLWFVIRNFGREGLQQKIRYHLKLAQWFKQQVEENSDYELLAPVLVNTICFRYLPANETDEGHLNQMNEQLLNRINQSGKIFMTHTRLQGKFTLRMSIGQTEIQKGQVEKAWQLIKVTAKSIKGVV